MQTSLLFLKPIIPGVDLFQLDFYPEHADSINPIPIGKQMESSFSQAIGRHKGYEMIAEGIQISKDKRTLGELDFIVRNLENDEILHIELVYKFYLYIPWIGNSEIERWIGPNFRDRLVYKMSKLKDHQFPILNNSLAIEKLMELGIQREQVNQKLCFCAELFLPVHGRDLPTFDVINKDCVQGQWIHQEQFGSFIHESLDFHVCEKWEWITIPSQDCEWYGHQEAHKRIREQLQSSRSPLVWIRSGRSIKKCFVIPNTRIEAA